MDARSRSKGPRSLLAWADDSPDTLQAGTLPEPGGVRARGESLGKCGARAWSEEQGECRPTIAQTSEERP